MKGRVTRDLEVEKKGDLETRRHTMGVAIDAVLEAC